jgi:hypothetical protein
VVNAGPRGEAQTELRLVPDLVDERVRDVDEGDLGDRGVDQASRSADDLLREDCSAVAMLVLLELD